MAGLTVRAASRASSKALYVDLPFRKLPAMPIILTEPAAGSAALVKPAEAAAAAAAAPRNRRRFMLLISSFAVGLPPCPKARGGQGKTAHRQDGAQRAGIAVPEGLSTAGKWVAGISRRYAAIQGRVRCSAPS